MLHLGVWGSLGFANKYYHIEDFGQIKEGKNGILLGHIFVLLFSFSHFYQCSLIVGAHSEGPILILWRLGAYTQCVDNQGDLPYFLVSKSRG